MSVWINGLKFSNSGLNSMSMVSGKLRLTAVADTWADYANSCAKYVFKMPLEKDFVIEATLDWTGSTNDLAQMFLYLKTETTSIFCGIEDAWASSGPRFHAKISTTDEYYTGASTRPNSGTATFKIERVGSTINIYEDGNLRLTGSLSEKITELYLTNTRFSTYVGNTADWYNISIPDLKSHYEQLFDGLIAAYDFKGNAMDWSGNGNDGTVTGAVLTTDRFGIANSAYYFDGIDDYILVNSNIDANQDLTISYWIKTIDENVMPFSKYVITSPYTQGYRMWIQTGGVVEMLVGDSAGNKVEPITTTTVNDDQWHHIVGTWNNTTKTAKIYIDGALRASETNTLIGDPSNSEILTIGVRNTNLDFDYDGKIDEFKIFNRVLSADEVKALYDLELKKDIYTYGF